jgi:hypothetical protein
MSDAEDQSLGIRRDGNMTMRPAISFAGNNPDIPLNLIGLDSGLQTVTQPQ